MNKSKREKRRLKRQALLGPTRALRETLERDGVTLERLECGHEIPAGPSRTTQTPGQVYRRCFLCLNSSL